MTQHKTLYRSTRLGVGEIQAGVGEIQAGVGEIQTGVGEVYTVCRGYWGHFQLVYPDLSTRNIINRKSHSDFSVV